MPEQEKYLTNKAGTMGPYTENSYLTNYHVTKEKPLKELKTVNFMDFLVTWVTRKLSLEIDIVRTYNQN